MNKNMKPVIAVAGISLAVSIAFTGLVGCSGGGDGDETTTMPSIFGTSDPADTGNTSDPASESSSEPETDPQELVYETVDETVYITVESVYLRTAPVIAENTVAGYGVKGESYRRVKKNAEWSVILLDGEEVYVSSDCVSTTDPASMDVVFNPVDKTIFVTVDQVSLRDYPSTDDTVSIRVASAVKDQELVAIGLSEDGKWYKINYKNAENEERVLYVHASCVTDEIVGADFTALSKQVRVTASSVAIRTYPSTDADKSTAIAYASTDTVITVIGVSPDGNWYKIKFTPSNGTEGTYYMTASSKYVVDVEAATTTEATASTTEADPAGTTEAPAT